MSRLEELKAVAQEFVEKLVAKFSGSEEEIPDGAYQFAEGQEVAIECGRPGTFVPMGGKKVTLTAEDLKGIASRFQTSDEDPRHLKIGHVPIKTDTPDYGRVTRLVYDEAKGRLIAYAKPEPELVKKNRAEGFRRCSMELVKKAGDWTLDALSLLGAKKPAIDGLAAIQLADGSQLCFASPEGDGSEADPDDLDAKKPLSKEKEEGGLDNGSTLPREEEIEQEKQKMSDQNAAELAAAKERIARFEKDAQITAKGREKAFLDEHVKRIPRTARKAVEGRLAALFASDALAEKEQRLEFAGADGKPVKETPSEMLTAILAALPEQTTEEEEEDTTKDKGADAPGSNVKPFALGRNPKVKFAESDRDQKVLSLLEEMRKSKPTTTYTQALEAFSEQELAK